MNNSRSQIEQHAESVWTFVKPDDQHAQGRMELRMLKDQGRIRGHTLHDFQIGVIQAMSMTPTVTMELEPKAVSKDWWSKLTYSDPALNDRSPDETIALDFGAGVSIIRIDSSNSIYSRWTKTATNPDAVRPAPGLHLALFFNQALPKHRRHFRLSWAKLLYIQVCWTIYDTARIHQKIRSSQVSGPKPDVL